MAAGKTIYSLARYRTEAAKLPFELFIDSNTSITTCRFGLATPLAAGETVTIDTRPTMQSAVGQAGRNRWPDLVKAAPGGCGRLVSGGNVVDLHMAGVESASRIR